MESGRAFVPYIILIIIVILIRFFVVTPVQVVGPSMESTLFNGDIMLLNKLTYSKREVRRFDIIVIKTDKTPIIKRVIGLPGEKLEIIKGDIFINDEKIVQDFDYHKFEENYDLNGYDQIPENMFFVLGDNRNDSYDSRFFGLVKRENILGNANYVIWPIENMGSK